MPSNSDYDDERDDDRQDEQQPSWRRKLEQDARAGREAAAELAKVQAEAEQVKRELAMRRAGVDLDSPLGQMFSRGYDQALDHDTLTQQWAAVNPAANAQASADAAAMARISAAQAGGTPSGANVPDFEAELDAIPMVVDGQWNPDYTNEVLKATAAQAAREGREFVVSGGRMIPQVAGPAITPLSG
jgi:hypothetical protein